MHNPDLLDERCHLADAAVPTRQNGRRRGTGCKGKCEEVKFSPKRRDFRPAAPLSTSCRAICASAIVCSMKPRLVYVVRRHEQKERNQRVSIVSAICTRGRGNPRFGVMLYHPFLSLGGRCLGRSHNLVDKCDCWSTQHSRSFLCTRPTSTCSYRIWPRREVILCK